MRNPRAIQAEKPCSIQIQHQTSEAMKGKRKRRKKSPGGNGLCRKPWWAFQFWRRLLGRRGSGGSPLVKRDASNTHFGDGERTRSHPGGVVWVPESGNCNSCATAQLHRLPGHKDPRNGYYSLPVRHLREGRLRYVNLLSGAGLVANGSPCVKITHSARFSRREGVFGATDCEEVLMG